MKPLGRFGLILQLGLGSIAFAALFTSSLATAERVFLGASLILIAFLIELGIIATYELHVGQMKSLGAILSALEKRLKGEDSSLTEALERQRQSDRLDEIASGEGVAYVLVLLAQYAIWLIAGWALAWFITHGF